MIKLNIKEVSVMQSEQLRGTIVKLIFQNPDTWYSVCDVETDTHGLVTVVGIMPYASAGEGLLVEGVWLQTKEYGRQFKVEKYEKIMPKKTNEILKYLSSGAIKGIGPKIAQKIVEKYGEDSFDVIEKHPDWLVEIRGISRKKAYEISLDFKEKAGVREILTFCGGDISTNSAIKIYKTWGRNALNKIKENPYFLCSSQVGLGFKRVDEMAMKMGVDTDSSERITSAIKYVLEVFASRDGHTYVYEDKLCDAVSKLINIDVDRIKASLVDVLSTNYVIKKSKNGTNVYALKSLYEAERIISKKIIEINKKAIFLNGDNIDHVINQAEYENGIEYADKQRKAIWECIVNGVTVLTGGPGTGKTTIIKAVIQIFSQFGLSCALCAPTGRAAKRMTEATSNEAKTIHRLLEVTTIDEISNDPDFSRNENNHIEEDVIIVDEASMIDVPLMRSLIVAIKPGARLILVGDINQLPSVGEGNVLNDIINSEKLRTVRLTEIFRQARNSGIVINAHKINQGIHPDLSEKYEDFFFVQKSVSEIPVYVSELCKERLPKKYGKAIVDDIQVIIPHKKGYSGTRSLNLILQESLNPADASKTECDATRERKIRLGDRVMQVRNDYTAEWESHSGVSGMGVFNGDIGIIKKMDNDEKQFVVDFGEKYVYYPFTYIEEIDHAYAITIHKSQGSEYPIVIIPITSECPNLLRTRNLIYTAITRASKMVVLIGDINVFYEMIDNNSQFKRNTFLESFIRETEK